MFNSLWRISLMLVASLLVAGTCWSQTDVTSLENMLKGKRLVLRSYSADAVANYELVNGTLVVAEAKARTIGVFTTRSVTLNGSKLVLGGERSTLVQDVSKRTFGLNGKAAMTLVVQLGDAELAATLPKIDSLLFFPDINTAVNSLPEQMKGLLPYDVSHTRHIGLQWFDDGGKWRALPSSDKKIALPVPTVMPSPEYTEQDRKDETTGSVSVAAEVTDTGSVKDLWLGNSLKDGVDERALSAVRHYRFKPARLDGRNVGIEIFVVVDWRVQ